MNSKFAVSRRTTLFGAACAALLAAPAAATVHTLTATANGVEETPANLSLGLATATFSLDDVAMTVTITTGGYTGLMTNASTAHIHGLSGLGVAAPVMIPLLVTGGTTGTLSGGGSLSAAEVAGMLNGQTYLNVHTTGLPNGEIRGQILKAPAGSSTFCYGDGSIVTQCPCGPPNTVPSPPAAPLHGCASQFDLNGSLLKVSGNTSPDTVQFLADIGKSSAAFGFLLKGNGSNPNGVPSSDGILCVDGAFIRFGAHNAGTNGAPLGLWTYPNSVQTTAVSIASAQAPASTSSYQLFYRAALANFCNASAANVSSGILIPWP